MWDFVATWWLFWWGVAAFIFALRYWASLPTRIRVLWHVTVLLALVVEQMGNQVERLNGAQLELIANGILVTFAFALTEALMPKSAVVRIER